MKIVVNSYRMPICEKKDQKNVVEPKTAEKTNGNGPYAIEQLKKNHRKNLKIVFGGAKKTD